MSKIANLIIVGGTIAAGKSTLVENISKATGWEPISELREGDRLQELILEKMYEGTRLHLATVQYYFMTNRYMQYKEASRSMITSILDRGPWEDWFFAKLLMASEPKSYNHYKKLWKTTMEEIIKNFGKPKAYIYTKVNWENFKKRIYGRNRDAEIKNFSANESYFRELLNEYNENFISILEEWGIEPIVINTNILSKDEVTQAVLKELKNKSLI